MQIIETKMFTSTHLTDLQTAINDWIKQRPADVQLMSSATPWIAVVNILAADPVYPAQPIYPLPWFPSPISPTLTPVLPDGWTITCEVTHNTGGQA